MYETISRFVEKNRWLILYGAFGIGTIVVNMSVFAFGVRYLMMSTFMSNIVAWFLSMLFSYISNHKWVFENVSHDFYGVMKELVSFLGCRVMTGIIDVLLMVLLVDFIHIYDIGAKVIVNFIVIVINLFACKHIVFKASDEVNSIEELEL